MYFIIAAVPFQPGFSVRLFENAPVSMNTSKINCKTTLRVLSPNLAVVNALLDCKADLCAVNLRN